MSDLCSPTFAGLAQRLGFSCDTAGGLVQFRNPLALENWTLPVLEITVIVGAVLALVYAIRRWRRQMAMVRPPMRALAEALDAAALTGHTEAGAIAGLAQFPQLPGTRWVGLPFETVDGTMRRPDVSLSAVVFGEFDPSRRFAGILVDEWTEVVPERQTATSVAFQYDAPNARPPQAILLAVTPPQTPAWSADTLVSIVNESLDLARLRLLTPGQIPGAGAVLPTAFVPTNLSDEVPSWHFFERFTATAGDHLILGRS